MQNTTTARIAFERGRGRTRQQLKKTLLVEKQMHRRGSNVPGGWTDHAHQCAVMTGGLHEDYHGTKGIRTTWADCFWHGWTK
jgi:hypothetical protein